MVATMSSAAYGFETMPLARRYVEPAPECGLPEGVAAEMSIPVHGAAQLHPAAMTYSAGVHPGAWFQPASGRTTVGVVSSDPLGATSPATRRRLARRQARRSERV